MKQFSIRTFIHRLSQLRHVKHKKVDFIVIGAQKSGTSSLRQYLNMHPDVQMSFTKEPHFFDSHRYSSHPISHYWYEKDFYQGDHSKLLGEVTPILSYLAQAPQRIKTYNPDIKLIMILRNPIERAYSHWNMEVDRGIETEDFLRAIELEEERLQSKNSELNMYHSYLDRGYYSVQVKRLKSLFPDDQLLFLKYSDYVDQQESSIHQVLDFIGVSPQSYTYKAQSVHKRSYGRSMTEQVKKVLIEKYEQDISELELLLGWDCADWLPFNCHI